jgi:hypothetical protein
MATTTPATETPTAAVPEAEEQRRLQREKNQALIDLLRSWLDETDPEVIREQRETWEFLKQALDEDRPSYRKLFPEGWDRR